MEISKAIRGIVDRMLSRMKFWWMVNLFVCVEGNRLNRCYRLQRYERFLVCILIKTPNTSLKGIHHHTILPQNERKMSRQVIHWNKTSNCHATFDKQLHNPLWIWDKIIVEFSNHENSLELFQFYDVNNLGIMDILLGINFECFILIETRCLKIKLKFLWNSYSYKIELKFKRFCC